MLMAWRPLDTELRRGSLPGQVQLPSFSSFLSGIESPNGAPARTNANLVNQAESPNGPSGGQFPSYTDSLHRQSQPLHGSSPESARTGHHSTALRPDLPPLRVHTEPDLRGRDLGIPLAAAPIFHNRSQSMTTPNRPTLNSGTRSPSHTKTVVEEVNIAGKGLCYVYDDGTICQKTINGDTVNPKWGTTKAGKPRKRLGQACNTCREKKIRCDPQIPKCAQCQKFGRECKFESRPSHKTTSSNSPRESLVSDHGKDTGHDRNGSSGSAETFASRTKSREDSRSSMQVENLLSPSAVESSPSEDRPPSKRQKVSTSPQDLSNKMLLAIGSPRPTSDSSSPAPLSPTGYSLDVDPSSISPSLTKEYLDLYFLHRNREMFQLFPREAFMEWVFHERDKSPGDNMVLYALLASGSTLSSHKDREAHQRHFAKIAEQGLDRLAGAYTLQIVHTLLVLAMLSFVDADMDKAIAFCDSAARTAKRKRLYGEEILAHSSYPSGKICYGLGLTRSNDLKKRTFWIAYVMDNLQACYFPGKQCAGYDACSLRLPSDDSLHDENTRLETPIYRGHLAPSATFETNPRVGSLAFLVEIATIINKILSFPAETRGLSLSEWQVAYESFRRETKRRLQEWDAKATTHLAISKRTGKRVAGGSPAQHGPDLRILHHYATMALNRVVRHEHTLPEHVERNCREAHHSAIKLLELIKDIRDNGGSDNSDDDFAKCNPISGFAILMAVDIITAAGTTSSVLEQERPWMELGSHLSFIELLSIGQGALETLSHYWKTASFQLDLVKRRFVTILNESRSGGVAFYFSEPLADMFGLEHDIVYGTSRLAFLKAIGLQAKVKSESDLFEMGGTN